MPAQVLVVDQNPLVQSTIETCLNSRNCEVTSVRDALSGLDLAYKIKPDLMIADLRMEGLMVYSFCARVKQKSFLSHIPIFLLVQQNDVYDEAKLRASGVVGFIQKPVDPVKLNETLNPFLTRFSDAPVLADQPAYLPASVATRNEDNGAAPLSKNMIDEKGEEFNMDQTVFDKTMIETKGDLPSIKPEDTVKIDDLMDWAQPEVSPFSEVISTPPSDDSSEVTQLADVSRLMNENSSASPFSTEDFSEVTPFADATQLKSEYEEEKLKSDFLQETVQEQTLTSSINGKMTPDRSSVSKPVSMPLSGDPLEISKAAQEIIEKVAWEVVPHLTEEAIKKGLIATMIEKVIWEVLPPIAEQSVKEAIKKISEEQEQEPSPS